jgi:hypothetical protein
MQEFVTPMRLLESYNLYPDCLSLQVEASPTRSDSQRFDLYLTVHCNEQWKSLLDGRIKFALKGGELKLSLENLEIDLINSDLSELFQITTTISATHPTWRFSPKLGELILKGDIDRVKLGVLTIRDRPHSLAATFAISKADISLIDAENLWRHDITPNKHGVLERAIALLLLENRFTPYLSWTQLGSQDYNDWTTLLKERQATLAPELLFQIKQLIDRIYEAKTDNFLELIELAQLNPLEDLTGGNFLAVNLSGIELSGANLFRTNFRGAVLTDVDLSEANLSHAKLSGADLSGAYLGNANLSHADFSRASLALANLIGSDLTSANLQEANLSNTNFSGATVLQAKFSDNPGLEEEVKLSLKEGGAAID